MFIPTSLMLIEFGYNLEYTWPGITYKYYSGMRAESRADTSYVEFCRFSWLSFAAFNFFRNPWHIYLEIP